MHPAVSAERWTALRALWTGAAPTFPRLAAAAGLHPATIRERAMLDSWPKMNFRRAGVWTDAGWAAGAAASSMAATAAAAAAMGGEDGADGETEDAAPRRSRQELLASAVSRQVEGVLLGAENGRLDKGQIDAVLAMIRMTSEAGQVTANESGGAAQSEEQVAETMRLIDERIVELALGLAERMGVRVEGD